MGSVFLVFGILFVVASPFLVIMHPTILEWATPLLEKHLSEDGELHPESESRLATFSYYSFMLIPLGIGIILLCCQSGPVLHATKPILLPLAGGVLLTIPALPHVYGFGTPAPVRFLIAEDGPLETATAIAFILAAFFLGKAALSVARIMKDSTGTSHKWVLCVLILLVLVTFFLAMEEISWGQRIFGWQTPASVASLNQQEETNIHNLVRFSTLQTTYKLLGFLPLIVVAGVWLRTRGNQEKSYSCVLPRYSLLGPAILIGVLALVSAYPPAELLEELLSFFTLLYSIQTARCLNAQATGFSTNR